ncbi:hypothetical protein [Dactylosporangium sp. CS-033363]|uniref:hypothetical protein n=1 Tax=Dactylosporangium sp. CS-033363 TaxID=3239935 RepID=UPI003D902BC0
MPPIKRRPVVDDEMIKAPPPPPNTPQRRDDDDEPSTAAEPAPASAPAPPAPPVVQQPSVEAAAPPVRATIARRSPTIRQPDEDDGRRMIEDPLATMLGGGIDPELDLGNLSTRVPRYVLDALDAFVRINRRTRQQNVVSDALRGILPPALLDRAYLERYGRERPRPSGDSSR